MGKWKEAAMAEQEAKMKAQKPKYYRVDHSQCIHLLKNNLQKRCHGIHSLSFQDSGSDFFIHSSTSGLTFSANKNDDAFIVNGLIEITNDHLLNFQDPLLLFDAVSKLIAIRETTDMDIRVVKNELVMPLEYPPFSNHFIYETILNKLDKVIELNKKFPFTLQLMPSGHLAINRCLKIFPRGLFQIKNCLEILNFVILYQKCFSTKPIVCRMQSLSPSADICPLDEFTSFHISENASAYFEISHFLYPSFSDFSEAHLTKCYLQIIPVDIVSMKKPLKILEMFQNYKRDNIYVEPLSIGHFRVANYFDFDINTLLAISFTESFKEIVNGFKILKINPDLFIKMCDLISYEKSIKYRKICSFNLDNFLELFIVLKVYLIDVESVCDDTKIVIYHPCEKCTHNTIEKLVVVEDRFGFNLDILTQTAREHDAFINVFCKLIDVFNQLSLASEKMSIPSPKLFFYNQDILESYFENQFLSADRCYRYIGDKEFIVVDKRFIIKNDQISSEDRANLFLKIINMLKKFEVQEGLLLNFNQGQICTADNIQNLDQFEKNSSDIIRQAIEIFNKKEMKHVKFELSPNRTIVCKALCDPNKSIVYKELKFLSKSVIRNAFCGGVCEIHPNLLIKIKNLNLLSEVIEAVCDLLPNKEQTHYNPCVVFRISTLNETFKNVIKLWNPDLIGLDNELLKMENFNTVPLFMSKKFDHYIDFFQTLRDSRVSFIVQHDIIQIGTYFAFHVGVLENLDKNNFKRLPQLFQLLEKIKVDKNDEICITHQRFVNIGNNASHLQNLYEPTNSSSRPTSRKNQEDLFQCFTIINRSLKNIHANIKLNGILRINSVFILPSILLSIQEESISDFFEAVIIYSDLVRPAFAHPAYWLNICAEIDISKNNFKSVGGFSIVEDNIGTFTKIVKLLQRNIEIIPEKLIISSTKFELLSSDFIMENPGSLLQLLEELKNEKCEVCISEANMLCSDSITLTMKKFLKIIDVKKFARANSILSKLPPAKDLARDTKNSLSDVVVAGDKYMIFPSGFLYSATCKKDIELNLLFNTSETEKSYIECILPQIVVLDAFLRKQGSKLSLTLNSNGNLQVGNFIWSRFYVFSSIKRKNVWQICETFDRAFEDRSDAMQTIANIEDAAVFDIAKSLAKDLNKVLKDFPDSLFKNKYFRVIPKQLHEKLNTNSKDTSTQLKAVLEMLKKEKKKWLLTFNGHIEIERCIILTIYHLLNIQNLDNFIELISFLKNEHTEERKQVICEEEILVDKYEAYKEIDKVMPKEMLKILSDIKNTAAFSRIEPDLTILFEKRLWVRPNDYASNKEKIHKLNSKLKAVFGDSSKFRFQFGAHYQRVTTTLLTTSEEHLYEYCRNFCTFIKEEDPSINIKYIVDNQRSPPRHLFRFNDEISIHPRSFFHLKSAADFIAAMNYWSTTADEEDIKRKKFLRLIADIKEKEKLDFPSLKKFVYTELEKIFFDKNYKSFINEHIPFVSTTTSNNKEQFYNIEKIKIGDASFFLYGNFNSLIATSKVGPILAFSPEHILIALRFVAEMHDILNFKNTSHLVSIMNAIKEYCDGKRTENGKIVKTTSTKNIKEIFQFENDYKEMFKVFQKVLKNIKDSINRFKHNYQLPSVSSNLHHWFKHGQDFESFEDYYKTMNKFFKTCKNYIEEVDTQEGISFFRTFSDKQYVGVIIEDIDLLNQEQLNSSKVKTVLTFYKDKGHKEKKAASKVQKEEQKKSLPYEIVSLSEKVSEKYLIITEQSLFEYKSGTLENVGVYLSDKPITNLITSLNRYPFKADNLVEKVLILLEKSYLPKEEKKKLNKKFSDPNINNSLNVLQGPAPDPSHIQGSSKTSIVGVKRIKPVKKPNDIKLLMKNNIEKLFDELLSTFTKAEIYICKLSEINEKNKGDSICHAEYGIDAPACLKKIYKTCLFFYKF